MGALHEPGSARGFFLFCFFLVFSCPCSEETAEFLFMQSLYDTRYTHIYVHLHLKSKAVSPCWSSQWVFPSQCSGIWCSSWRPQFPPETASEWDQRSRPGLTPSSDWTGFVQKLYTKPKDMGYISARSLLILPLCKLLTTRWHFIIVFIGCQILRALLTPTKMHLRAPERGRKVQFVESLFIFSLFIIFSTVRFKWFFTKTRTWQGVLLVTPAFPCSSQAVYEPKHGQHTPCSSGRQILKKREWMHNNREANNYFHNFNKSKLTFQCNYRSLALWKKSLYAVPKSVLHIHI